MREFNVTELFQKRNNSFLLILRHMSKENEYLEKYGK